MDSSVNETIERLMKIEETAARVYKNAAGVFSYDKALSAFLEEMEKDENFHLAALQATRKHISEKDLRPAAFAMDLKTMQKFSSLFSKCENEIDNRLVTTDGIMSCIVDAEFSEWNEIFMYFLNIFNGSQRDLIPFVTQIEQHKRRIKRFLESRPEYEHLLNKIKKLPELWREKILVVDRSHFISDLIEAVLAGEGCVERAGSGNEALKMMTKNYYAAIVNDTGMHVNGGIEFYEAAVQIYPHLKERVLFYASDDDSRNISFFNKSKIRYLIKPVPLHELKKAITDILGRIPTAGKTRFGSRQT